MIWSTPVPYFSRLYCNFIECKISSLNYVWQSNVSDFFSVTSLRRNDDNLKMFSILLTAIPINVEIHVLCIPPTWRRFHNQAYLIFKNANLKIWLSGAHIRVSPDFNTKFVSFLCYCFPVTQEKHGYTLTEMHTRLHFINW